MDKHNQLAQQNEQLQNDNTQMLLKKAMRTENAACLKSSRAAPERTPLLCGQNEDAISE